MEWLYKSDDPLLQTLLACVAVFFVIITFTRIVGLRSFAKFTAYDFATTVAVGSIISSILTSSTTLLHGTVAVGGLLFLTFVFSVLQRKFNWFDRTISNTPILLMDGPTILEENLRKARVQKSQLIAKLREANVMNFDQVIAVVLESTGDVSVLHCADEDITFEPKLLEGVKR